MDQTSSQVCREIPVNRKTYIFMPNFHKAGGNDSILFRKSSESIMNKESNFN